MLVHAAESLRRLDSPSADRNMVIESLALHVRNLGEFFKQSKPGYVRASDFGYPVKGNLFAHLVTRASVEIVHLGHGRASRTEAQREWALRDLLPLLRECADFAKAAGLDVPAVRVLVEELQLETVTSLSALSAVEAVARPMMSSAATTAVVKLHSTVRSPE